MNKTLLCCLALLAPQLAFGWGAIAHKIVTNEGSNLVSEAVLKNCQVSVELLTDHTNDPDTTWKGQRKKFPKEAQAHYFHVAQQPTDWKTRTEAKNYKDGYLVYRIVSWVDQAKALRKAQKWDELKEKLFGLTHYLGDITQPLHLHHDYDGVGAGLPGLHSQFETKMIGRFEDRVRSGVKANLQAEKIPAIWNQIKFETLVFNIAEQSMLKADQLFSGAKPAREKQNRRKNAPSSKQEKELYRFVKEKLWKGTGDLATSQMALGSRLVGKMLTEVCQ